MFSNIASNITNYIVYVFFISLISFVFLYLYKRVNVLENSLIEHGKILQNFIQNYNYQIINSTIPNNTSYEKSNLSFNNDESNTVQNSRDIQHLDNSAKDLDDDSDDDDSDDDSDNNDSDNDDSDNDDSDNDDSDNDDSDNDNDDSDNDDSDNDDNSDVSEKLDVLQDSECLEFSDDKIDILENIQPQSNFNELINIEEFNVTKNIQDLNNGDEINNILDLNNTDISNNNVEDTDIKFINIVNNEDIDITLSQEIMINDSDNVLQEKKQKSYKKMKVDDLKLLVVTRNLLDNEQAEKLKKSELIKLLET